MSVIPCSGTVIIESVDSISRDEPDLHICKYITKKVNKSATVNF